MNTNKLTRRSIFKISGATLGSAVLASNLAYGTSLVGLEDRLVDVIVENIPDTDETKARAFVQDMLANKLELLESQDFIKAESKSFHSEKLERFVVVQYLISVN